MEKLLTYKVGKGSILSLGDFRGGGGHCKTGEILVQDGFTEAMLEQTCSLYRLTSGPTALRVNGVITNLDRPADKSC